MEWESCDVSQFEFCHVAGATFYVGDDGHLGKPVFGAVFFFGETTELYRGSDIGAAKQACQEHLEGLNK